MQKTCKFKIYSQFERGFGEEQHYSFNIQKSHWDSTTSCCRCLIQCHNNCWMHLKIMGNNFISNDFPCCLTLIDLNLNVDPLLSRPLSQQLKTYGTNFDCKLRVVFFRPWKHRINLFVKVTVLSGQTDDWYLLNFGFYCSYLKSSW